MFFQFRDVSPSNYANYLARIKHFLLKSYEIGAHIIGAPDFNVFMAINFVGKVLNSDIGHAAFNLSEHLDHANVELCPVLLVAKFLLSMA